ncbi:hypothetical protein BOX15_Mlig008338g2 [Macrostomum lignano]|uniref:Uncharacterized protein n=1 Tax=Macrostomum lignano TaxID=282301 RepID=A0A267DEI0_9PLAT|nr:hypothetical protein BOX15_Mlig008338g2 [Macrostomum lignano]
MASESGLTACVSIVPYKLKEEIKYQLNDKEFSKLCQKIDAKKDDLQLLLQNQSNGNFNLVTVTQKQVSDSSNTDSDSSDDEDCLKGFPEIELKISIVDFSSDHLQHFKDFVCQQTGGLIELITKSVKVQNDIAFSILFEEEYYKSLLKNAKKLHAWTTKMATKSLAGATNNYTSRTVKSTAATDTCADTTAAKSAATTDNFDDTISAKSAATDTDADTTAAKSAATDTDADTTAAKSAATDTDADTTAAKTAFGRHTEMDASVLPEFLPAVFFSKSELQNLTVEDQKKYVQYEFRLCLPDLFSYLEKYQFRNIYRNSSLRKKVAELAMCHILKNMHGFTVSLVLSNEKLNRLYQEIPNKVDGSNYYCLPAWQVYIRSDAAEHISYQFNISECGEMIDLFHCEEYRKLTNQFGFFESLKQVSIKSLLTEGLNDIVKEKLLRKIRETKCRKLHKDCFLQFAIFGRYETLKRLPDARSLTALMFSFCYECFENTEIVDSIPSIYIHFITKFLKPLLEKADFSVQKQFSNDFIACVSFFILNPQITQFYPFSADGKALAGILFVRIMSIIRQPDADIQLERKVADLFLNFINDPIIPELDDDFLKCLDHAGCIDTIFAIYRKASSRTGKCNTSFLKLLDKLRCPKRLDLRFIPVVTDCLMRSKNHANDEMMIEFCYIAHKNGFDLNDCEASLALYIASNDKESCSRKAKEFLNSAESTQGLDPSVLSFIKKVLRERAISGALESLKCDKGLTVPEILKSARIILPADNSEDANADKIETIRAAFLKSLENYPAEDELCSAAAFAELLRITCLEQKDAFAWQLVKKILEKKSRFRSEFVRKFNTLPINTHLKETSGQMKGQSHEILSTYLLACEEESNKLPQEAIEDLLLDCSESKHKDFKDACLVAYENVLRNQRLCGNVLESAFSTSNPELLNAAVKICAECLRHSCSERSEIVVEYFLQKDVLKSKNHQPNRDTVSLMVELLRASLKNAWEVEQQIQVLRQHCHIWQWVESAANEELSSEFGKEAVNCLGSLSAYFQMFTSFNLTANDFNAFVTVYMSDENEERQTCEAIDSIANLLLHNQVGRVNFQEVVKEGKSAIDTWLHQQMAMKKIIAFFTEVKTSYGVNLRRSKGTLPSL